MIDATGTPQRILLLGGSSELGLAIVRRLLRARRGQVVLAGRPSSQLDQACQDLTSAGHDVEVVGFDAAATETHASVLAEVFASDVDVTIVAFGQLGDQPTLLAEPDRAVALAQTNYLGALSVGLRLAHHLRRQGHGHVLALSSVAAERPRRANLVYASTKAGFDAVFSGLADELHGSGAGVTVLRPGFVHTRMTAGLSPAPFATTPDRVAELAARAVRTRTPLVWAPPVLRMVMLVLRVLPRPVFRRLNR